MGIASKALSAHCIGFGNDDDLDEMPRLLRLRSFNCWQLDIKNVAPLDILLTRLLRLV